MSSNEYITVKLEDDGEAVIIEGMQIEKAENEPSIPKLLPAEQNSQAESQQHYIAQVVYGFDGSSVVNGPMITQVAHPAREQDEAHCTEEVGYNFMPKRRRVSSALGNSLNPPQLRTRETEYESNGDVVYEYETDYECASEASYNGEQQRTLTEILNYCQVMYEAIQKLDKKFDSLQRKVMEVQHVQMKPVFLKPRTVELSQRSSHPIPLGKMRLQKPTEREARFHLSPSVRRTHGAPLRVRIQKNCTGVKSIRSSPNSESQQPQFNTPGRQSPPLPTIVSTHSLRPPSVQYSVPSRAPDIAQMATILDTSLKSSAVSTGSPLRHTIADTAFREKESASVDHVPSPEAGFPEPPSACEQLCSESSNMSLECIGDPKRNVKVPGNFLMKARQKTKAKYAARYLIRVLFTKETLLCSSVLGDSTRDLKPLDPNKIAAMREFLAVTFPTYDLSEDGRDWKTCVTNLNAMLRSMRNETRKVAERTDGNKKVPVDQGTSICVELDSDGEDSAPTVVQVPQQTTPPPSAPVTSGAVPGSSPGQPWEQDCVSVPACDKQQNVEPMEFLGKRWRNILLPFSVLYVAKRKSRPELAARYLIRHLFPEDVLVKSNVYGNPERGVAPLDFNKINALRDFLEETYQSFDLNESGYDWRACVAAINSTIRSLRHDQKKGLMGARKRQQPEYKLEIKPPGSSLSQENTGGNNTINLLD
ncbi:uncharacterized protein LOC102345245 isoform X2 [Latimeria chalumnae]|uniref:uncharacterized protein LOC102345245 isoform X2 n=1 Tax=Latimeria chalumnae TaxID=7897 RepID=UPI00313C1D7C